MQLCGSADAVIRPSGHQSSQQHLALQDSEICSVAARGGGLSRGYSPFFGSYGMGFGVSVMVGTYETASSASSTLVTLPSTASGAWSQEVCGENRDTIGP
eukprot:scaffold17608_cov57-Phaeocystis_antarctica.AAC.1